MPLRVKRSQDKAELPVTEADEASVDSELSALGLLQRPIKGPLENRYYESTRRFPEHKETRGQFITGRLDAADDDTVKRMIKDTIKRKKPTFSESAYGFRTFSELLEQAVPQQVTKRSRQRPRLRRVVQVGDLIGVANLPQSRQIMLRCRAD